MRRQPKMSTSGQDFLFGFIVGAIAMALLLWLL